MFWLLGAPGQKGFGLFVYEMLNFGSWGSLLKSLIEKVVQKIVPQASFSNDFGPFLILGRIGGFGRPWAQRVRHFCVGMLCFGSWAPLGKKGSAFLYMKCYVLALGRPWAKRVRPFCT